MPLGTPDVLLTGNDAVAQSSFSFTGTTPIVGKLVLAAVRTARAANPLVPLSFTAFGLAWGAPVTTILGGTVRLTVYRATAIAPVGTTVFVDVNDGGANHSSCSVAIVAHADDITPSVQQSQSGSGSGTAVGATLPLPPLADNGVSCFALALNAVASFAPEAGYTEALDYGVGTGGAARFCYIWRADGADASPTATANASGLWLAVALELGEPPPTPFDVEVFPGTGLAPKQTVHLSEHRAEVTVDIHTATVEVLPWRNSVEVI